MMRALADGPKLIICDEVISRWIRCRHAHGADRRGGGAEIAGPGAALRSLYRVAAVLGFRDRSRLAEQPFGRGYS